MLVQVKQSKTNLMKKLTFVLLLSFLLSGCVAPLPDKSEIYSKIDPNERTLVFLNSTKWDHEFRVALQNEGFKVLKYASRESVTQRSEDFTKEKSFNKAEARYGIDQFFDRKDFCITPKSDLLEIKLEIVDLRTNEVVMFFQKEGWTTTCWHPSTKYVFDVLAEEINSKWKN